MLSLYLLLLTFKIVGCIACAFYCFKISKLKLTQTFTWVLFASAFIFRFLTYIQALVYTQDIVGIYANYPILLVLANQIVEAVIIALFFIGIARSYYGMETLFVKPNLTK